MTHREIWGGIAMRKVKIPALCDSAISEVQFDRLLDTVRKAVETAPPNPVDDSQLARPRSGRLVGRPLISKAPATKASRR
jgi:hypothetical protein